MFSMHDPDVLQRLLRDGGYAMTPMGAAVANAPRGAQSVLEQDVVGQWRQLTGDGLS